MLDGNGVLAEKGVDDLGVEGGDEILSLLHLGVASSMLGAEGPCQGRQRSGENGFDDCSCPVDGGWPSAVDGIIVVVLHDSEGVKDFLQPLTVDMGKVGASRL